MLKDRLKQKAKKKAKQKVRSEAKNQVRQAARRESGPKVLKAAAVGGAGYYAGKKISESGQEVQADTYASPPGPEPGMATADAGSDTVAQLQQLAQLHESGVLTDEEFASAKQKVLAGG
jgi:hypothetical protein